MPQPAWAKARITSSQPCQTMRPMAMPSPASASKKAERFIMSGCFFLRGLQHAERFGVQAGATRGAHAAIAAERQGFALPSRCLAARRFDHGHERHDVMQLEGGFNHKVNHAHRE